MAELSIMQSKVECWAEQALNLWQRLKWASICLNATDYSSCMCYKIKVDQLLTVTTNMKHGIYEKLLQATESLNNSCKTVNYEDQLEVLQGKVEEVEGNVKRQTDELLMYPTGLQASQMKSPSLPGKRRHQSRSKNVSCPEISEQTLVRNLHDVHHCRKSKDVHDSLYIKRFQDHPAFKKGKNVKESNPVAINVPTKRRNSCLKNSISLSFLDLPKRACAKVYDDSSCKKNSTIQKKNFKNKQSNRSVLEKVNKVKKSMPVHSSIAKSIPSSLQRSSKASPKNRSHPEQPKYAQSNALNPVRRSMRLMNSMNMSFPALPKSDQKALQAAKIRTLRKFGVTKDLKIYNTDTAILKSEMMVFDILNPQDPKKTQKKLIKPDAVKTNNAMSHITESNPFEIAEKTKIVTFMGPKKNKIRPASLENCVTKQSTTTEDFSKEIQPTDHKNVHLGNGSSSRNMSRVPTEKLVGRPSAFKRSVTRMDSIGEEVTDSSPHQSPIPNPVDLLCAKKVVIKLTPLNNCTTKTATSAEEIKPMDYKDSPDGNSSLMSCDDSCDIPSYIQTKYDMSKVPTMKAADFPSTFKGFVKKMNAVCKEMADTVPHLTPISKPPLVSRHRHYDDLKFNTVVDAGSDTLNFTSEEMDDDDLDLFPPRVPSVVQTKTKNYASFLIESKFIRNNSAPVIIPKLGGTRTKESAFNWCNTWLL